MKTKDKTDVFSIGTDGGKKPVIPMMVVKTTKKIKNKYYHCKKCGAYVTGKYLSEHQCDSLMSILYGCHLSNKKVKHSKQK